MVARVDTAGISTSLAYDRMVAHWRTAETFARRRIISFWRSTGMSDAASLPESIGAEYARSSGMPPLRIARRRFVRNRIRLSASSWTVALRARAS